MARESYKAKVQRLENELASREQRIDELTAALKRSNDIISLYQNKDEASFIASPTFIQMKGKIELLESKIFILEKENNRLK